MSKEEITDKQIKEAYYVYAESHTRVGFDGWLLTTPMEHSLESFTELCNNNRKYYNKYKPKKK
jgi:hypothetical protein